MGGKKVLLLFLGLGMPILVFLFLKFFGRNEFDVPTPALDPPADCQLTDTVKYHVADSVIKQIQTGPFELLIINFGEESKKLNRLTDSFQSEVVKVEKARLDTLPEIERIKRCSFFVLGSRSVVLIDSQKKIRGYYDGTDRDELDRLEAEVKIILKRY